MLRKLAASSDANLGALQAAGALPVLLELLRDTPPASGRAAGAMHLLRDLALYAPASRCGRLPMLCDSARCRSSAPAAERSACQRLSARPLAVHNSGALCSSATCTACGCRLGRKVLRLAF